MTRSTSKTFAKAADVDSVDVSAMGMVCQWYVNGMSMVCQWYVMENVNGM